MSNQEIQRVAEFHVFERNLYQMPQRAPLANGILDPRLVRAPFQPRLACLAASRRCWSLLFPALQGTTDKKGECQTCKGKLADCGGHYGARRRHNRLLAGLSSFFLPHTGYIRLELPVFHVGYFKNIIAILQCVCKTCAHVMVPEDERRQYQRRFRSPQTEVRRLRRLAHAPRLIPACPCRR